MPNIKSAVKRVQITKIQNAKNSAARSALKTSIRRFEEAVASNSENVGEALKNASQALDKAAASGLIHKNKAARKKSRMSKKYSATQAS